MLANAVLRDFDLVAPIPRDQCQLGILVDGLLLFGAVQLAVGTTPRVTVALRLFSSSSRGDRRWCRRGRGAQSQRDDLPRTRRARMVQHAGVVGCRRSEETRSSRQSQIKVRAAIVTRWAEQAWRMRWGVLLVCAAALGLVSLPHLGRIKIVGFLCGSSRPPCFWIFVDASCVGTHTVRLRRTIVCQLRCCQKMHVRRRTCLQPLSLAMPSINCSICPCVCLLSFVERSSSQATESGPNVV